MLKTELGRLRKANRKLKGSFDLKLEDHELLKQMLNYLEHKRLNPYDFETVRADLLGMAQEAKKRQQPLRELIGDDRAFCDSLVANCNKSSFSVMVLKWLVVPLGVFFIVYLLNFFINGGYRLFLGQLYTQTFTAYQILASVLLWVIYAVLWMQIIPLPYAVYKHTGGLFFLVATSWYFVLRKIFLQAIPEFLNTMLFTVNGFANLAVIALLGLGWLGMQYAADTLAYKQSSFGGGETHVEN